MFTEILREDGKRQRTYVLPGRCSIGSVTLRELDGHDDITIAMWVDRKKGSTGDLLSKMEQARTEAIRRSIVLVDERPVGENNVPYPGLETWSHRTMLFVADAFNALNSIENDELKVFRAEQTEQTEGTIRPSLREVPSGSERSAG